MSRTPSANDPTDMNASDIMAALASLDGDGDVTVCYWYVHGGQTRREFVVGLRGRKVRAYVADNGMCQDARRIRTYCGGIEHAAHAIIADIQEHRLD